MSYPSVSLVHGGPLLQLEVGLLHRLCLKRLVPDELCLTDALDPLSEHILHNVYSSGPLDQNQVGL